MGIDRPTEDPTKKIAKAEAEEISPPTGSETETEAAKAAEALKGPVDARHLIFPKNVGKLDLSGGEQTSPEGLPETIGGDPNKNPDRQ